MIRQRNPLPPGIERCPATRGEYCDQAGQCARAVEPHALGRTVVDFSVKPRLLTGACGWFLPVQYAEPASVQPTVHDAPGWLG
jgi:hypothetical protein